jgi:hypothetical protein
MSYSRYITKNLDTTQGERQELRAQMDWRRVLLPLLGAIGVVGGAIFAIDRYYKRKKSKELSTKGVQVVTLMR